MSAVVYRYYYTSKWKILQLFLGFIGELFGKDNKYGHPHDEVLERLTKINSLEADYMLRTDEMGDVSFSSVEGNLNYYIEKQGTEAKIGISFRLLTAIVACSIIVLIFSVKPIKRRRR